MTNFIPLFPLNIVVFPDEVLNLHIFEPRYKQLITECFANAKPFGIPAVLDDTVCEFGTTVSVTEIVTVHDNGNMDIRVKGLEVFKVLEIIKTIPEKLYSGGIVNYPQNSMVSYKTMMYQVLELIRTLHKLLNVTKDFKKLDDNLISYDVAHHASLTIKEEYELLGLLNEAQRLTYLKNHLQKVLPLVAGLEGLKAKIALNGHFKELEGFNFNI